LELEWKSNDTKRREGKQSSMKQKAYTTRTRKGEGGVGNGTHTKERQSEVHRGDILFARIKPGKCSWQKKHEYPG
jgi:hypothetical protein